MLHKNFVVSDACQSIHAGEISSPTQRNSHYIYGFCVSCPQTTVNDLEWRQCAVVARFKWWTNTVDLMLIKALESNERCNLQTYTKQLNLAQWVATTFTCKVLRICGEMRPRFRRMALTWSCLSPLRPSGALTHCWPPKQRCRGLREWKWPLAFNSLYNILLMLLLIITNKRLCWVKKWFSEITDKSSQFAQRLVKKNNLKHCGQLSSINEKHLHNVENRGYGSWPSFN